MNHEPWIGDVAPNPNGTCTYSADEGLPECGAPATVHVLTESAIHGVVSLPSCAQHAVSARAAGRYIAEHPYGLRCLAPVTYWHDAGCEAAP